MKSATQKVQETTGMILLYLMKNANGYYGFTKWKTLSTPAVYSVWDWDQEWSKICQLQISMAAVVSVLP